MDLDVSEPPEFTLTVARDEGPAVLVVAGEMDIETAPRFAEAVRRQLEWGPVTIDMRELVFIDSSGMRTLDALMREAADAGRRLTLRSDLHRNVRQMLRLTGVLDHLVLEGPLP